MSKQIAVRLPDDIVDFIDQSVDNGQASSRAIVVARAIDCERQRAVARATRPSWLVSTPILISTALPSMPRVRP